MSFFKEYQNLKWELPTLSLLYNCKCGISQCYYKIYDLMNVEFYQFVSFLFKDTTPQPNNLSKKKVSFYANLFKILDLRILMRTQQFTKPEELLRWNNITIYKIKKSLI